MSQALDNLSDSDFDVQDPFLESTAEIPDPVKSSPRGQDVLVKQQRIAEFLEDEGYDAVFLGRQNSFAWFTSGGDSGHGVAGDLGRVAIFATPEQRCILADNSQSGQIFDEEISGLGFQLKEYPWWQNQDRIINDICRGRKVACDLGLPGTINEFEKLKRLRINLTDLERSRYEQVGSATAHAIEATCRNARPNITEQEIAAEAAHRMIRHGIRPVVMSVIGDSRLWNYGLAAPGPQSVNKCFTIQATGQRYGLCATLSRTVFFGGVDPEFQRCHNACTMVSATYIFFARPDEHASEIWRRANRIYEKNGWPHEWQNNPQGGVTGYSPCELALTPKSPFRFRAGMVAAWTPTIGPAKCSDTVLLTQPGHSYLTLTGQWPAVTVSVKGYEVDRPSILTL